MTFGQMQWLHAFLKKYERFIAGKQHKASQKYSRLRSDWINGNAKYEWAEKAWDECMAWADEGQMLGGVIKGLEETVWKIEK